MLLVLVPRDTGLFFLPRVKDTRPKWHYHIMTRRGSTIACIFYAPLSHDLHEEKSPNTAMNAVLLQGEAGGRGPMLG